MTGTFTDLTRGMNGASDREAWGRVLLSQVMFTVSIYRQQTPFGSTTADFDASEWEYRVRSLHAASENPVIEFEREDLIPAEVGIRWTHPTGMTFRLCFKLVGIVGRSYAAYDVECEREFP